MSNLIIKLPQYYQDSPPVTELERVIGLQAEALLDAREDTVKQLWIDTATWGLDLWEQWVGLPVDRSGSYGARRGRIKAKLRGQGTTTAEMIANVVASFGYDAEQVSVVEHSESYQFEVILSNLAEAPGDTEDIIDAVNEIKPAHLDWWFTYELAQLLTNIRIGTGLWRIQELKLAMNEEA